MRRVLLMACVYNLLWGSWAILAPLHSFGYSGFAVPDRPLLYPQLWQGIGFIVAVMGIGYALAALHPYRYWPVVAMGLIAKVGSPLALLGNVLMGWERSAALLPTIPNDLIWWGPFAAILYGAWRANTLAKGTE
jgi:hypothetical protein